MSYWRAIAGQLCKNSFFKTTGQGRYSDSVTKVHYFT